MFSISSIKVELWMIFTFVKCFLEQLFCCLPPGTLTGARSLPPLTFCPEKRNIPITRPTHLTQAFTTQQKREALLLSVAPWDDIALNQVSYHLLPSLSSDSLLKPKANPSTCDHSPFTLLHRGTNLTGGSDCSWTAGERGGCLQRQSPSHPMECQGCWGKDWAASLGPTRLVNL